MNFRVEQSTKNRESFGNYDYLIYKDEKLVATYWHDYRGDCYGIRFINGKTGSAVPNNFLVGGGPKPHELSVSAIEYLREHV